MPKSTLGSPGVKHFFGTAGATESQIDVADFGESRVRAVDCASRGGGAGCGFTRIRPFSGSSGDAQHQVSRIAGSLRVDRPATGRRENPAGAPLLAGPMPGAVAVLLGTPDRLDHCAVGPVALTEKSPLPIMRQTTLISWPAVNAGCVGKNSAHSVTPLPAPCRSGNVADPPNWAVGGQVEVVTGPAVADAGGWSGPSGVWDEGCDCAPCVASHAATASAHTRPSHHLHVADRAHTAKRMGEPYRGPERATSSC
jgi:hypothetical protein